MSGHVSRKVRRQSLILDALRHDPAKRVSELSEELGVSTETVRRDLTELDASGRIKRTYGGAIRTAQFEPALAERLKLHLAERDRIAKCAVRLLHDIDSLFLGGGATTLHVARALSTLDRQLTVLTASFGIAMELAQNPLIEVVALPGRVEHGEGMVCGPDTLKHTARHRTPAAVMGASAIDETGVSEALLSAAQVYECMIESAAHTFVVADGSKFGSRALRKILSWDADTTLITDQLPESALSQFLCDAGTTIRVAD